MACPARIEDPVPEYVVGIRDSITRLSELARDQVYECSNEEVESDQCATKAAAPVTNAAGCALRRSANMYNAAGLTRQVAERHRRRPPVCRSEGQRSANQFRARIHRVCCQPHPTPTQLPHPEFPTHGIQFHPSCLMAVAQD